jgi:hypothetical protein
MWGEGMSPLKSKEFIPVYGISEKLNRTLFPLVTHLEKMACDTI